MWGVFIGPVLLRTQISIRKINTVRDREVMEDFQLFR